MICVPRRRALGCLTFLIVTPLVVLLAAPWWLPAIGHWLAISPRPGESDVIVVLGGGQERLIEAIALYHEQPTAALWQTGDPGGVITGTFTTEMLAAAIAQERGVPPEHFQFLNSTSTWEDASATAAQAKSTVARRLIIVTSWYHSRRALCVFHRQLNGQEVELLYVPSPDDFSPDDWWHGEEGLVAVMNELLKTALYWRTYGLAPWRC